MEHAKGNKSTANESYAFLMDSLKEIKRQLTTIEPIIALKYKELLPHIEILNEQTSDFMESIHVVEPIVKEAVEVKSTDYSEVNSNKLSGRGEYAKSAHQGIVIKVSSHQYIPKVFHPHALVTYKKETIE